MSASLRELVKQGRRPGKGSIHGSRQPRKQRRLDAAVPVDDDSAHPNKASFVVGDEGSGYLPTPPWWRPLTGQGAPAPYYVGVTNIVATCRHDADVPLDQVAAVSAGRFESGRFPAVSVPLLSPRVTVVWFATGNVVIAGARTEAQVILAAHVFLSHLWRCTGRVFRVFDMQIQNWVGCASFGMRLALHRMVHDYSIYMHWNRSIFAGLRYSPAPPPERRPVINVFEPGCLVITGATSRQHLIDAHRELYYRFLPYLEDLTALRGREGDVRIAIELVQASAIRPLRFLEPGCAYLAALDAARCSTQTV